MASACPCLACGLTTAKGDRRTLEGSSADRIVPIWKEFVTTVAQEQGITISEQQHVVSYLMYLHQIQKMELDLCTENVFIALEGI